MDKSIVFVGAGASDPFHIPTMTKLVEDFEDKLRSSYSPHLSLFEDIKYRLQNYKNFDIEALITVLQDIIEIDELPTKVLNQPSVHYFSAWGMSFESMVNTIREDALRNRDQAEQLLKEVKGFVAESCTLKKQSFDIYMEFFKYVMLKDGYNLENALRGQGPYKIRSVIFTTNYDQVIEAFCRRKNLNYGCGQVQNELLDIGKSNHMLYSKDSPLFQIYKLHGSINWYEDQDKNMRWLTEPARPGRMTPLGDQVIKELLIYPAREKYTFREPFYPMFHHLKECLIGCERCYIVGYSFRDDDILGLFHDAMNLNKGLSLFVVDRNANTIVEEKFQSLSDRIQALETEFSVRTGKELYELTSR